MLEIILKPLWNLKKFLSKIRQMPRPFNMHKRYAKGSPRRNRIDLPFENCAVQSKTCKKTAGARSSGRLSIYMQPFNSYPLRNPKSEEFDKIGRAHV